MLREWADSHGVEVVQLPAGNHDREVAPFGEVDACDLVVAIGGDGTVLSALRAAAPRTRRCWASPAAASARWPPSAPIACPSALEAYESGSWRRRQVPALEVSVGGEQVAWALNDFVAVRRAGQQLTVDVTVDGELYARMAGDGVIVATALGSSAYSMAARGPLLVLDSEAFVVTPLTIHGGSIPPLVIPARCTVVLDVFPGWGGFDLEIDGQTVEIEGRSSRWRSCPTARRSWGSASRSSGSRRCAVAG